ncbi:MAG: Gx transporter family protein [Clostridiales bacterium]|nr:Gx transporter family protein [Clostridiales bacterium]
MRAKSGSTAKDVSELAALLAAALIAGLFERLIPFDFAVPGVKLGLSNAVVLMSLYLLGAGRAFMLAVLKCFAIALVSGDWAAFMYSISGSMMSFFAMLMTKRALGGENGASPIGVSAVGAVFHNIGQLLMAAFILGSLNVMAYLPVLAISGIITGILVGFIVKFALPAVKKARRSARG